MDTRKRRIKHKQQRKRGTSHCPFNLTYLDHIEHRIYINICNVVLLIRGVIARPADQFMNTERERERRGASEKGLLYVPPVEARVKLLCVLHELGHFMGVQLRMGQEVLCSRQRYIDTIDLYIHMYSSIHSSIPTKHTSTHSIPPISQQQMNCIPFLC